MSNLISHQQFLKDAENNLHTTDYLLFHMGCISKFFNIIETTHLGQYTLEIYSNSKNELMLEISGGAENRLELGFLVLDTIYQDYKPAAVLRIVN